MAIWPFNRNKPADYSNIEQEQLPVEQEPSSNLPEEVQEYYESGKRERVGVAWLLGLLTLCVTLILAMGLFFGGRWVYRKIANNDKPDTTSQISQDDKSKSNKDQGKQNSGSAPSSDAQNKPASPSPAPSTPAPAPQPAPAPSPAPISPAPAPAATPNTGPGDVVAIAIASAVVSTIGFYALQLRRLS